MDRLDAAYRQALGRLRTRTSTEAQAIFRQGIDEDDIVGSFEKALPAIVDVISDAQAAARDTAQGYVAARVDQLTPDDDPPWEPIPIDEERIGQNKDGRPLADAMAGIGPAILARHKKNNGAPPIPAAQAALERLRRARE